MKSAAKLALALATASLLGAQENQLDGNKTLFTVMAAMNAAGFNAQADSSSNSPLRQQIRDEVLRRKPPSLADIRRFRLRQRIDDPALELRQYEGYAFLVRGAPNFQLKLLRNELPPDVASMEELGPVFEKFYKEAGIEELWKQSQPTIERMLEHYHTPVIEAVQRINGYLRVPSGSGYLGKTFQIIFDPLGPPNEILFHSLFGDYYIVVTPSAEPQINDIRRAYMHFLIDPMATAAASEFKAAHALGELVQGAPTLAADFKTDFLLLATRSLIRAIEARLTYPAGAAREADVDTAMKEGFILTAHFAEQLPIYEKQEVSLRLYFPDMVKAIDLGREEKRIAKLEFVTHSAVRIARGPKPEQAPAPPELTGFALRLDQAEELYIKRQLPEARVIFLEVAEKAPEKPSQAKAYYGLARIAVLSRDPELAEKLFQRTLELEPEDTVKAWAHVYLGRLDEAAGDAPGAVEAYKEALKVTGITDGARQAAEQGLKKAQNPAQGKEQ